MPTKPTSKNPSNETPAPPPTRWQRIWHGWIKPIGIVLIVLGCFRSSIADWNDVPSSSMEPTVLIGDRVVVNKLAFGLNPPFNGPKIGIPLTGITFSNPLRFLPGIHWRQPRRGDIITFWSPKPDHSAAGIDGTRLIKRVVALAGDHIRWTSEGQLIVTTPEGKTYEATYDDVKPVIINGSDGRGRAFAREGVQETELLDDQTRTIQRFLGPGPLRPFPGGDDKMAYSVGEAANPEEGYLIPEGCLWAMGDNRDLSGDSRVFGPVPLNLVTGRAFAIAFSHDGWSVRWSRLFKGL